MTVDNEALIRIMETRNTLARFRLMFFRVEKAYRAYEQGTEGFERACIDVATQLKGRGSLKASLVYVCECLKYPLFDIDSQNQKPNSKKPKEV